MDETLHTLPPLDERKSRTHEVRVVNPRGRIDEMHGCEIAFGTLGRGDAPEAADRDGTRRKSRLGERPHDDVEGNAMAAHNHKIGQCGGIADQGDAGVCTGVE